MAKKYNRIMLGRAGRFARKFNQNCKYFIETA